MDWINDVVYFAQSDVGIKRSHNQDSFGAAKAQTNDALTARGHLFVVADGMGSHAVGELASKMAVDAILHLYAKVCNGTPAPSLEQSIIEANQAIFEKGTLNQEFQGMGTTATALVLSPEGVHVGHVGDSRCYRIRGNTIEQLSFDHSLLWDVARRRNVDPDQIHEVPSNIIIRSLGPEPNVRVDINGPYPVLEGDRFLLCTDGLSGPVDDRELWAAATSLSGTEACRFLVNLANLRGGLDNITIMIVQVGDPQKSTDGRREPLGRRLKRRLLKAWAKLPNPWKFLSAALAGSAVALAVRETLLPEQFLISGLAAAALVAGMAWLVIDQKRKRNSDLKKPSNGPSIFRTREYSIDETMLEHLQQIAKTLFELALEERWDIQAETIHLRQSEGDAAVQKGDFHGAYREYSLLVSSLTQAMRQRRAKQEVFTPQWEKKGR